MISEEQLACPYCDAPLSAGVLSCRCCGRDLSPILPLLRRLSSLELRVAELAKTEAERASAIRPESSGAEIAIADADPPQALAAPESRRAWPLVVGFLALMAVHAAVVLWLDLPLAVLRFSSLALPLGVGLLYIGRRPGVTWLDFAAALAFSVVTIATMNAVVGWFDSVPLLPTGAAAWRETLFYGLSISASVFAGMLLRVSHTALTARGLTSLPRLRESLLAANRNMPMDTLKAIELTILLAGTALSAVTGLVAGLIGVSR